MKKIIYILIVLFLTAGFGCKKEMKKTVVEGTVRDFITGNPLDGTEVYLQEFEYNSNDQIINKRTFSNLTTAVDGKFNFEFHALKDKFYGLEYQKPSHCYFDKNDPDRQFATGKKTVLDIKLHSYLNLNIHIKNITPFDSADQICYYLIKDVPGCITAPVVGAGVDYWDTFTWQAYEKVYIKSFVTKNSILTIKLDSIINVPPCYTLTYNLFY